MNIASMSSQKGSKATPSKLLAKMSVESNVHLCWCAGGIILSLMVYSILQVNAWPCLTLLAFCCKQKRDFPAMEKIYGPC